MVTCRGKDFSLAGSIRCLTVAKKSGRENLFHRGLIGFHILPDD
jgi:hypothetical protein